MSKKLPPRYVIVSDCDQPAPNMICQWVPGIGYCYLDRTGSKPGHDGMNADGVTSVEQFGISWADNSDGTVSFFPSGKPVTATYHDGKARKWQSKATSFCREQIAPAAVRGMAKGVILP